MHRISRRTATQSLLLALVGCGGESSDAPGGASGASGASGSSGSSGGSSGGGSSSGGSSGTSGVASSSGGSSGATTSSSSSGGSANAWAGGGTKSMTAKASYPDPFANPSTTCTLFVAATAGPCTEAADRVRVDVSEGKGGLPMRVALRIVDAACKPIPNAKVKIWHTEIAGSYTGDTPNPQSCITKASEASNHAFRGVQTTDANGRVDFDSCFPGWYAGRTIHIHFSVTANGKTFTSQLLFDDTLVDEIFTTHAEYKPYGLPDTHNTDDGIVTKGSTAAYVMAAARMNDGAMLASKQISVNL